MEPHFTESFQALLSKGEIQIEWKPQKKGVK